MELEKLHEDNRGSISLLTGDMKWDEVTIFHTEAEYARGGCIHRNSDEYTCVIEGEVIYQIGTKTIELKTGESYMIPKNTPHYFWSVINSIVIEWGAKPEEKKQKHLEFRKIVDLINKCRGGETF